LSRAPLFFRLQGIGSRAPVHPGRFLETRYLIPAGLTQTEAARRLGISRRRLNEILQGHRAISPDTALRLALYFGTDATLWLGLQAAWDTHQAWRSLVRANATGWKDGCQ
jgi:addiction module HigA family antidote